MKTSLEQLNVEPKKSEVSRFLEGGLLLCVNRPEFSTYRLAGATNLSFVLDQLGKEVDLLLMTSFPGSENDGTGPRSRSQTEEDFRLLPAELRRKLGTRNIGAYWLIGHWTRDSSDEDPESSEVVVESSDCVEYSWLFAKLDPSISSEQWLAAAGELAAEHGQNQFVLRSEGRSSLRASDGTVLRNLSTEIAIAQTWAEMAKIRGSNKGGLRESVYCVRGTGAKHAIEFYLAKPHNNSASMMFSIKGISYQA